MFELSGLEDKNCIMDYCLASWVLDVSEIFTIFHQRAWTKSNQRKKLSVERLMRRNDVTVTRRLAVTNDGQRWLCRWTYASSCRSTVHACIMPVSETKVLFASLVRASSVLIFSVNPDQILKSLKKSIISFKNVRNIYTENFYITSKEYEKLYKRKI